MPETPREIEHTITLPLGLVLKGRVVDAATGQGVAKALVDFNRTPDGKEAPTLFSLSQETGPDGTFRVVVPPGRGTVFLRTIPKVFPQPERQYTGQPVDPKLNREVSGAAGETVQVEEFKLAHRPRDRATSGRLGRASGGRRRGRGARLKPHVRHDACPLGRGREVHGRRPITRVRHRGRHHRRWAARWAQRSRSRMRPQAVANNREIEVRLEPLVSLSGRVLDENGKPIAGPTRQPVPRRQISRARAGGHSARRSRPSTK